MIRRWGVIWHDTGLGRTIVFIAIWAITRISDNFITGRGGRVSEDGILTEVFQIAFAAIVIAILILEKNSIIKEAKTDRS